MAITIDIDTARPYQVHVGTFLLEQAGSLARHCRRHQGRHRDGHQRGPALPDAR